MSSEEHPRRALVQSLAAWLPKSATPVNGPPGRGKSMPRRRVIALVEGESAEYDMLPLLDYVSSDGHTRLGEVWRYASELTALEVHVHRRLAPQRPYSPSDALAELVANAMDLEAASVSIALPDVHMQVDHRAAPDPAADAPLRDPAVFGTLSLSARPWPACDAGQPDLHAALAEVFRTADASGLDLTAVAELIAVVRDNLWRVVDSLLSPIAYEYIDHVPPHACSPCGVIRMAAPAIPRGPQVPLFFDAPTALWTLAA